MCSIVIEEGVYPIPIEVFDAYVYKQQISGSIVPDMLSPRTFMMRIFSAFLPSNMCLASSCEYQPSGVFPRILD